MTSFVRRVGPAVRTSPAHYWIVRRMPRDVLSRVQGEPLAGFTAYPPSNVWQAQNAMIALQRRGIACYMDTMTVQEEIPA